MALEVKVFREITAYQPKILAGMSVRQLVVSAVFLPILFGSYAVLYLRGLEDLGVIAISVLALPGVCLGWVRPMGIPFERYVGYWWRYQGGRHNQPWIYCDREFDSDVSEQKHTPKRKRIAKLEVSGC
ncbi:PrgI family protein [Trueperella sp. LYQ143]|uniref:PrgI family protein n=1 Tax=Trueperella sp. LYQ143 TaxID=3391059 RepID=UPI003983A481